MSQGTDGLGAIITKYDFSDLDIFLFNKLDEN